MEISEYETLVNELELRVERLRSLYDQYFMGIEKTVPSVPRKDVERRIQTLRREQIRNTGLRFRFQMIIQRYGTYQTYWQRICRQIEEGTYKRHVQKARAKIQAQELPKRHDSGGYDIDVEFEMEMLEMESQAPDDLDPPTTPFEPPVLDPPTPLLGVPAPVMPIVGAPRPLWRKVEPAAPTAASGSGPRAPAPAAIAPAAPPPVAPKPAAAPPVAPKPAAPPARPAAAAAPVASSPKPEAREAREALTEARKRELYSRYVEAKRSRGESTVGITYESMSRTLRESSEKLREKHGKTVDFEVTVKDGKTILKPILK